MPCQRRRYRWHAGRRRRGGGRMDELARRVATAGDADERRLLSVQALVRVAAAVDAPLDLVLLLCSGRASLDDRLVADPRLKAAEQHLAPSTVGEQVALACGRHRAVRGPIKRAQPQRGSVPSVLEGVEHDQSEARVGRARQRGWWRRWRRWQSRR